MQKRTRGDLWTDIIIVGGTIAVLTVASTSMYLHWQEMHDSAAAERVTKVYRPK